MSDTTPSTPSASPPPRRGGRLFWSIFKWCRVAVLLLLLGALILLLFLHQAGLPLPLQEQLIGRLREAGWEVKFARLRLRWYQGIVAEQLALHPTNGPAGLAVFVERAQFELDWGALRHLRLEADGLRLAGARLVLPPPPPAPGMPALDPALTIDRIHGDLRFHRGDRWELRSLEGHCLGLNLRVRGEVTQALRVQDWRLGRPRPPRPPGAGEPAWNQILAQLRQLKAASPPEIQVEFTADGAGPHTLQATLKVLAPAFISPWGAATNLTLHARLHPAADPGSPQPASLTLTATHPHTVWGQADQMTAALHWTDILLRPWEGAGSLKLAGPRTSWGRAEQVALEAHAAPGQDEHTDWRLTAEAREPASPAGRAAAARLQVRASLPQDVTRPFQARIQHEFRELRTRRATSEWGRVEGTLALPGRGHLRLFRTALAWPERAQGIEAALSGVFSNTHGAGLTLQHAALTNTWRPDGLHLQVAADPAGTRLTADVWLDPLTRAARVSASAQGDPHRFAHLLPVGARPWLAEYQPRAPLTLQAAASTILPPWDTAGSNWLRATVAHLGLAGRVQSGAGTFLQVPFDGAGASGLYTNGQLTLPDIRVQAGGGTLEADVTADLGTGDFVARGTSGLNPLLLRPAFGPRVQQQGFDLFTFTTPPQVRAEARGSLHDWARLSVQGDTLFTNFTVRSQFIASVRSRFLFTNQFLALLQPSLWRGPREGGQADGISFDTATQRLYLTNAQGTLDAVVLGRILGPIVEPVLRPYVFDAPPRILAHGRLPLRRGDDTEDAIFEVEGGPFHWNRFHFDQVRGRIHWLGEAKTVTLTNLAGRWCGADAAGWLHLDFRQPRGGALALHATVEGANLNAVIRDLRGGVSNQLEGTFRGELNITEALLDAPGSWQGNARVELREGLIWDIPLFAVISPILNSVIPGLGRSRAREGRATCVISNSVILSEDLEIRASAMQLKYRGSVDFQGGIDAVMEAELFRNVPAFGMVLSKVLWPVTKLFEYRVSGTLDEPRLDERYFVPKLLLLPLQPVKTLKDLLGQEKPPAAAPPPPPAVPPAPVP